MSDTNGTAAPPARDAALLRVLSAAVSRAQLGARLGTTHGGARQMADVLGYAGTLSYRDFKAKYLRQDLAHRIVKAYPEATWAQPPVIKEDNTDAADTPFEAAWKTLATRLHVFATLERLDTLANLGQYSVLLVGLAGQPDLHTPARPVRSADDVLYLAPYSEEWATVEALETNAALPTFGQPRVYRVDTARGRTPGAAVLVHATRVLHVAEDVLDDEIFGLPRLEPVFNLFDDLLKVCGGSAEAMWLDARRRIVFQLRDGAQMSREDEAALGEEVDEFMHQLKPFLRTQNIDVTPLPGQVASPRDHFDVILDLMAGATGIPKRILLGSEQGQLASGQDSDNWLARIVRRQTAFAEARMLRPLIDRCILLGALPTPGTSYTVSWENLYSLSEEKQAVVARDVATAINAYAPGLAATIIPPSEFRVRYLGLEPEPDGGFLDLDPGDDDASPDDAAPAAEEPAP